MKFLMIVVTGLSLTLSQLASASPQEKLIELLQPVVNGAGQFEQITLDQQGETLQASSGEFAVMQPGKFYWQTTQPYEQLLVSDGKTIWLHDPDLEQVTVKSFSSEQNQLPIRLLSGDFGLLNSEFSLASASGGGLQTFVLTPVAANSSVVGIELIFSQDELTTMTVTDSAQTATRFVFSQRQPLQPGDQDKFVFVVPEGADVFHDE